MKQKEKAKNLFDKMFSSSRSIEVEQSKKCALVAVDEIIKTIEYSSQADEMSKTSYWEEVKTEIKKL